jgi:chromosome segregation ATPase
MINDSVIIDIQRKTERIEMMFDRLDMSIEKLTELSSNVSRLLAVHEEKFDNQQKVNSYFTNILEQRRTEMDNKLEDIWDELKDIRDEQRKQHQEINDKLSKFERFIWMAGGGGVVIGLILSYGPVIMKMVK